MGAYDDYLRVLQAGQQNQKLDNPYSGINHMLSSAIQGYLIGKDRRANKEFETTLSSALFPDAGNAATASSMQGAGLGNAYSSAGGAPPGLGVSAGANPQASALLSSQVGAPSGVPDYGRVTSALQGISGHNPQARQALVKLGLGDIEEAGKSRHKMAEKAFGGNVDMGVYRDRRLADMGFEEAQTGQLGLRGETKLDQDLRLAQGQAEAGVWEAGVTGQNETRELDIRGESDLDRKRRQFGYQADANVSEDYRKGKNETTELDVRGESDLGRLQRQYGYQTDEGLREHQGKTDIDVRNYDALHEKRSAATVGSDPAAAVESFFQGSGLDAEIGKVFVALAPKVAAGETLNPQEQVAMNYAKAMAMQPKNLEINGQLITIPPMTEEQIFKGMSLAQQPAQAQPWGPSVTSAQAVGGGPNLEQGVAWPALMKSLVRQESGGNAQAVSPKGARGLTQFMPETAEGVASRMGIRNFTFDMMDNPEVAMAMGEFHMKELVGKYNGNVPMALAAYNAGSGAVDKWRRTIGDPLKGEISVREWANRIPYKETNNYVKSIMGSYVRNAGDVVQSPAPALPAQMQAPTPPPQMPPQMQGPVQPPMQTPMQQPMPGPPTQGALPPGAQAYQVPQSQKEMALTEKAKADQLLAETKASTEQRDVANSMTKKQALLDVTNGRLDDITRILSNAGGGPTSGVTGFLSSYAPAGMDTNAKDVRYAIDAVKNQFTGANLDMMTGVLSNTDLAMLGGLAGDLGIVKDNKEKLRIVRDMQKILNAGSLSSGLRKQDIGKRTPVQSGGVTNPADMSDDELLKALETMQ